MKDEYRMRNDALGGMAVGEESFATELDREGLCSIYPSSFCIRHSAFIIHHSSFIIRHFAAIWGRSRRDEGKRLALYKRQYSFIESMADIVKESGLEEEDLVFGI